MTSNGTDKKLIRDSFAYMDAEGSDELVHPHSIACIFLINV